MTPGPVMLDLDGLELTPEEAQLIRRPEVGGIIFFTRNYQSPEQLLALVQSIRAERPDIILAVDHEGGRVQRFRDGFTQLPAMGRLGKLYQQDQAQALALSRDCGWLMAAELLAYDIDLSFAPVLDIDSGLSEVIGDRAFGQTPDHIIALAGAFIEGMHEAGMITTGKHFPGHGNVEADSHHALPEDTRSADQIFALDIKPFAGLMTGLDAVMPAHVVYAALDAKPAGFSSYWIKQVLRQELGFDGVVFSDDLDMEGASFAGDYAQRTHAALEAGCDMVLICNNRPAAEQVLDAVAGIEPSPRLLRLKARSQLSRDALVADPRWQATCDQIAVLTV